MFFAEPQKVTLNYSQHSSFCVIPCLNAIGFTSPKIRDDQGKLENFKVFDECNFDKFFLFS